MDGGRLDHWVEHGPLSVVQPLIALGLVDEHNGFDENEHAVCITVKREELGGGLRAAVTHRDGAEVCGCLHH